jgi:hypothetical protein
MRHDDVINATALQRRVKRHSREVLHIVLVKSVMARLAAGATPLVPIQSCGGTHFSFSFLAGRLETR